MLNEVQKQTHIDYKYLSPDSKRNGGSSGFWEKKTLNNKSFIRLFRVLYNSIADILTRHLYPEAP